MENTETAKGMGKEQQWTRQKEWSKGMGKETDQLRMAKRNMANEGRGS